MNTKVPNIVRQEDIYRAILALQEKIETMNAASNEDKLITISKVKELTGIDYDYWMEKIKSGEMPARYFPHKNRKRGGYRVWMSKLLEFINSPLFDPPAEKRHTVYFESTEDFARRLVKEINNA